MAKFYGKIGYAETVENPDDPGVWTENIIEKFYYGDVTKNSKRYESGEKIEGIEGWISMQDKTALMPSL